MYTRKKIWILTLLVLLSFHINVKAQYRRSSSFDITSGLSIVPKAGVNLFFGDLVDSSRENISLGVTADREMLEFVTLRASLMGGQMSGKQIYPVLEVPYATFTNFYVDFLIGGTYKPLDHFLKYFKERTAEPYILLQGGFIYYNSTEKWGEASIHTVGAAPGEVWRKASGVAAIVSGGGGVNFWLNPSLSLNLEFHGNLAFTDKLDAHDVWRDTYPDGDLHTTEPYDFYYIATAGVIYNIKESPFRNHPKYNRKRYSKTRNYYRTSSRKSVTRRRPSTHSNTKRFLFF